jgi:hypothetical protein
LELKTKETLYDVFVSFSLERAKEQICWFEQTQIDEFRGRVIPGCMSESKQTFTLEIFEKLNERILNKIYEQIEEPDLFKQD